ncbi:MAG: rod shape-determining protein MreC [Pseudomonadota bacterium]|nr:rod shape-determining protein MreC [Pseudomonadota bacterium]
MIIRSSKIRNPSVKFLSVIKRAAILIIVGFILLVLSRKTTLLTPVEKLTEHLLIPIHYVASIPEKISLGVSKFIFNNPDLETENRRLIQENLLYKGKAQRLGELEAENISLRLLLNASELLIDTILVTEVIGVSATPRVHKLRINRGRQDNIYVGQPVLDAEGLMGQVVEVYEKFSSVLLITDSTHALPVKVLRNGTRSVAEGISDFNTMKLRFVSPTSDIKVGDKIVSSGLGDRFPAGYPVGIVTSSDHKTGANFVDVEVEPSAQMNKSKHLLLVFDGRKTDGQK